MQFRVLGPLEIETGDGLLSVRGAKQRVLLAMLLMHPNEVVSRDLLIEALWGETAGARAAHSLEAQVSRLRKVLRAGGDEILSTHPTGYQLSLEPGELDLFVFESLLDQARAALDRGEADRAAATMRQALALWRGRAFEDVAYETFAQIEIERLDELRLGGLEDRIDADLALGHHAELVSELESLVRQYPLRESFRAQLMLALYRSGRQAEALGVYQDTRRALVDELGIEPGPALRELEQAILGQDPRLRGVEGEPRAVGRPAADEREKTVTLLFAEITAVGGSDGDAQTPEWALYGAGHELRVAVEYHGGTVERLTGGELMAVFGVPAAHEDDLARAARTALALRDAVATVNANLEQGLKIECRAAVVTGLVRVSAASGRPELSGAVLGFVRRLAETGDPDDILVDAATAARGAGALMTEPVEPRRLRGRPEEVNVVRLTDVAEGVGASREPTTPFVGRTNELGEVRSALEAAVAEDRCVIATVLGEAGIGKSRLVAEFASHLEAASVFTGKCVSYGDGATFLPLAEIVAQAAGAQSREEIERFLGDEEGAAMIAEHVEDLAGGSEGAGSTGEAFWAVRRFFERLAREQPLVLVFEDLHWAEPTLLDLIEYLESSSRGAPLLVLCLARPELLEARPQWPSETLIRLAPLTKEETVELIESAGGELADELQAQVADLAGGNPLFAEQLIAFASERQATTFSAVPPSIDALISSRLDLLDEQERAVLHRAAVVGRDFWHGAVLHLSPSIDVPAVGRIILELTRKGLIEPGTSALPREDAFRFHHVLIRDVAYNSTPQEVRSELHEQLVDWLDLQSGAQDELSGYHLEQAYECRLGSGHPDGHARRLAADGGRRLAGAGLRAAKAGDNHGASNLLGRACSLLDDEDVARQDLVAELGLVLWRAGEVGAAERALLSALELAVTAKERRGELRARLELANLNLFRKPEGGVHALVTLTEESLPLFEALDDARALGRIWYVLAFVRGGLHCHYRESEEAAERAVSYFRQSGWPVAPCLQELGASLYYGPTPVPEGIRRCRELIEGADRGGEAHLTGFLACLEAMEGRFEMARAGIARARTIYEDLAWTVHLTTNYAPLAADIEVLAGDHEAAERLLEESCAKLEQWGEHAHLATQAAQLGEAVYAQGRHDEALRWADVAAGCAADEDAGAQFSWRALRAKALAHEGRLAEAEALARDAAERAAATDTISQRATVLLACGEVLRLCGRAGAATENVEEARSLLERKGNEARLAQIRA